MAGESAVEMTRSLLQVSEFIDPATEEAVRLSASRLGEDTAPQENQVHVQVLRLIAVGRRSERKDAWDSTEEYYAHIRRRYMLQVRAAAKTLMRIVNDVRLDPYGKPLDTPAGRDMELFRFDEIMADRDENPYEVARHLKQAGAYRGSHARPDMNYRRRWYPADMLRYLEVYPPARLPQPGEMNRSGMRSFGASDNLLNRIIRQRVLYPVPRIFEGRGSREGEFFVPEDVAIIQEEIEAVPLKGPRERILSTLFQEFGSAVLGEKALVLSGMDAPERRLPGQGIGRCVSVAGVRYIRVAFKKLTTLQPGEAGVKEIMAYTGFSETRIRDHIHDADEPHTRPLYDQPDGKGRAIFPPPVVRQILLRLTDSTGRTFEMPEQFEQAGSRPVPIKVKATPARAPRTATPSPAKAARKGSSRPATPSANPTPSEPMPDLTTEVLAVAPAATAPPEGEIKPMAPEVEHEPRHAPWITEAGVATILVVEVTQIRTYLKISPAGPEQTKPLQTPRGTTKLHLRPDKVGEIARKILGERLRRTPTIQLDVRQISLLAERHHDDVTEAVARAGIVGIANADGRTTYNSTALQRIFQLFDITLD